MRLTEGGFSTGPFFSWEQKLSQSQWLHKDDHMHLCCCQDNGITFTTIIHCAWCVEDAHSIYRVN